MIKRIATVEEAKRLIEAGKDIMLTEKRCGEKTEHIINAKYNALIDTAKWFRSEGYNVLETKKDFCRVFAQRIVNYKHRDIQVTVLARILDEIMLLAPLFDFTSNNVIYDNNWEPYEYRIVPKLDVWVRNIAIKDAYLAVNIDDTDADAKSKGKAYAA